MLYKEWAGYFAVRSYDVTHDAEYYAIRHAAGLIDVTPLYKYEVRGKDACACLSRLMVRNIAKLKIGQAAYLCWCDDDGKMIDDGTVSRLDEDYYRVTSTDSNYSWFGRHARGYDLTLEDSTHRLAALAVQGPRSRDVINDATEGAVEDLKFFYVTKAKIGGVDVVVSRTGYTGDLGFEVWVDNDHAVRVYDAVLAAGKPHGALPAGLDAMDVARIEAGFILNGVDYFNALHAMIDRRKSTPLEMSLGWAVQLKRAPFTGSAALRQEKAAGPRRVFVGLDVDWDEFEDQFAQYGLPPEVHYGGWRDGVPVYSVDGRFIGQATSGAWSPLLKKNLALASLTAEEGKTGNQVLFEVTVEYERRKVKATVVDKPFYDPEWKRA
ncbi:MAG: aminomethyltransferase family protein [Candidatus Latescibacterota bacterium]